MNNLLIINAHPDRQSYSYALSTSYISGIDKNKWHVDVINLADLTFNPISGQLKQVEI